MNAMHLLYPQWQGAGNLPALADGARQLARARPDVAWQEVKVDAAAPLTLDAGILGRAALLAQWARAHTAIAEADPPQLWTLGGDCSVELAGVAHLARRYPGLTLVWLDAHADLNTPQTSPSGTLHGMPLRLLLGEGDPEVLAALPATLHPDQVLLAGVRELDAAEADFVQHSGLARVSAEELNAHPGALGDVLATRGAQPLYIHLDLDVLDPGEFAALGWPTPGGLTVETVLTVLADLHARFPVVGGGLTEYLPGSAADARTAARVLAGWLG